LLFVFVLVGGKNLNTDSVSVKLDGYNLKMFHRRHVCNHCLRNNIPYITACRLAIFYITSFYGSPVIALKIKGILKD
jgi:hypothetical protein